MEEQPTSSPVYKKNQEKIEMMSFPEAIKEIMAGKRVTKLEWNNQEVYGLLHDGFLQLHKADDKYYNWIINDGDLTGLDWVVIPQGN